MSRTFPRLPGIALVTLATLATAWACAGDFGVSPPLDLVVTPGGRNGEVEGWPEFLPVHLDASDTVGVDTLEVLLLRMGSESVTGMELEWSSSDPSVLGVEELPPVEGTREDSLSVQLRAVVTAHARGNATVTVRVLARPGVRASELSHTITVRERWSSVSVGASHACAVASDGRAYCWGRGKIGQLGDGRFEDVGSGASPRLVGDGVEFKTVSAGAGHSCGVDLRGQAWCWGWNVFGQLGDGTIIRRGLPSLVEAGWLWTTVEAGRIVTCGLSAEKGRVLCWGRAQNGIEAGLSPDTALHLLSDSRTLDGVCVDRSPCVRTPGAVAGGSGELGHSVMHASDYWLFFSPLEDRTGLSVGADAACSIGDRKEDFRTNETRGANPRPVIGTALVGRTHCWGLDAVRQLGVDEVLPRDRVANVRRTVGSPPDTVSLYAACTPEQAIPGPDGDCVRRATEVRGGDAFVQVSTGLDGDIEGGFPSSSWLAHTCGVTVGGSIDCWGSNKYEELGVAPGSPSLEQCSVKGSSVECATGPIRVAPPSDGGTWAAVSAGWGHTCALTDDGTAYCWGTVLYQGFPEEYLGPDPVRVPGALRFRSLDAGASFTCAIAAEDDALHCWGGFGYGPEPQRVPDPAPLAAAGGG